MASSNALSKANTTFCLDLLKQLSDINKTANVFFSPLSISSALAMVMLGARGNTASQMSESLKTQHCQDDVHANFGQLLSDLKKPDTEFSLSVANRLYGDQSYQFVEDFIEKTKKHYNAEMEAVDFKNSHEAARLNINTWMENQTQGKIKNLLAMGTMDESTKLVLVNAIYFKCNWLWKFLAEDTTDAQFKLNKKETKPVKMMHMQRIFDLNFVAEFNFQILELPYRDIELSMFIFLPMDIEDNSTGLEKLENQLTYEKFMEWTSRDMMTPHDVELSVPRFKMEENYDMKDVLINMGMVDAFDADMSDFSGMSPANELVLSKVVHKAFVGVDEEGTEAAAATAVNLMGCCLCPGATFTADHPFLFFIRHNATMSVLFAGRFCSPN